MKKRLYVAYGSNLNVRQMKYRCPTAKLYGVGTIEDYELQFKGSPNSAFATIAPKEGSSVPAAVREIQPTDEMFLDRYEGYPSHYFEQNVPVQLDGEAVSAMVYVMNLKMQFGVPSPYYYNTVLEGYHDCGLDSDILDQAVDDSTRRFYSETLKIQHRQQTLFDGYGAEDEDDGFDERSNDDGEEANEEDCESDPFYFSDGMSM